MSLMSELQDSIDAAPVIPVKEKIDGGKVNLPPQKIFALHAENVKRLTVVDITPGDNVVRITGENGAGKSSVLDAIQMALQGKGQALDKPVRTGKDKAYVLLETNDLIIKRVWTQKGESGYLEVTGKDGTEVTSPQRLLDRLVSKVAIDPLAFIGMDCKKQAEELMKLFPPADPSTGEAFNLGQNKKMTELAMDTRKDKAAALKLRQQDYQRLKDVPNDGPEAVDVKALNADMKRLSLAQSQRGNMTAQMEYALQDIESLKKQITAKEEYIAEMRKKVDAIPDPTVQLDLIESQIAKAESINKIAAKVTEKKSVLEAGKKAKQEWDASESRVNALKAARKAAFQSIEYPLEGLSISEEGDLLYNSLPIAQACTSEQIKIGIALGAAASPGMRIAFIKDGSLLDNNSMTTVSGFAVQFGMQIWVERVSDNDPVAIHIVEGSNVGATDADGKPGKKDEVFG